MSHLLVAAIAGQVPAAPPAGNADDLVQIADLIVMWSGVVLTGFALLVTVITLGVAAAGFFGIREIRNARRELTDESTQMRDLTNRYNAEFERADAVIETVVQSSYGFNQGQLAYSDGNYPRAVEYFKRASELQPSNVTILYRLGRAYTNTGDIGQANAVFEKAIEIDPKNAEPYRGIALCCRFDDISRALEYAQRATELNPQDPRGWNCLGLMKRDGGSLDDSIIAHEKARGLDPHRHVTSFYLALLYAATNKPALAGEFISAANENLDRLEDVGRLKPLWGYVLRWGRACFDGDVTNARLYAANAATAAQSERRRLEVGGHMIFLLTALRQTSEIEYLPESIKPNRRARGE